MISFSAFKKRMNDTHWQLKKKTWEHLRPRKESRNSRHRRRRYYEKLWVCTQDSIHHFTVDRQTPTPLGSNLEHVGNGEKVKGLF